MLKDILLPLVQYFSPLNVFQYITFRSAYAAVTALLLSFLLGPRVILGLKKLKFGEEIRSDGPKSHLAKSGTPTMGGLLIIASFVFSVLMWQDIPALYTWIVVLTCLGLGLLGFIDDYLKIHRPTSRGVNVSTKLISQFSVALLVMVLVYVFRNEYTTLLYIPFRKQPLLDMGWLYIPFGTFLIVGMSNAVNLTDGLDGLAVGLSIIVLLAFTVLSYLTGHMEFAEYLFIPGIKGAGELTVSTTALLGACVGFLWFNSHPAEVMMGDTGSLTLGGILAVFSILLKKEILLLVIGGVFVLEIFSVIIQVLYFRLTSKRVFLMAPLHHHFELIGWKESKVVLRFWILGAMLAILGLSTLKIQ